MSIESTKDRSRSDFLDDIYRIWAFMLCSGGHIWSMGRARPTKTNAGVKVLVACEFSGTVRDAFIRAGHDAMSCDLLPTESPGPHYQGDVWDIIYDGWDLMVAHPSCRYLTNAGVRWLHTRACRWDLMRSAAYFSKAFLDAPIEHIAVEKPIMHG